MSYGHRNRRARLRIRLDGEVLIGAYQATVESNNHYGADTFSVAVALGLDPWADAAFWSSAVGLTFDIQASIDDGATFTSLLLGTADSISLDPITGDAHVRGRDFTAALIDTPTQETFANRTSSEIVTMLASRHSLTPVVAATTSLVGRFYESEHSTTTLNCSSRLTTEWDLLVYLAQQENFDLFIRGNSIYFQPVVPATQITQTIRPQDLIELRLERTLTLAREIQVTVKSWNTQQRSAFIEQVNGTLATETASNSLFPSVAPQRYIVVRPNLTADKALVLAGQRLSELTRHERLVEFLMPGELDLAARDFVMLTGTGTEFDQGYYITTIARTFSTRTGFLQQVRASGSSPRLLSTSSSVG
ncbi:MAG TPA: hypothetical protein VMB34_03495 [Acetobacteraceae bacterium]|nr:hypothetical protein [Acetobacteraceae bacterium]